MDESTKLRVELANRFGKIGGSFVAVGNDYCAVRYTSDGRRMNIVKRFGEDESACRAYVELWNGPEEGRIG
jgi:hypothetical protein